MPYKLLLADDSVTIQRVIELTFADEDVTVTAVDDGQQAIDRIMADRPDIVLADVGMPRRDGYEVSAFIKDNPELAHIPVLLLTGAFEPVDEERARAVRCNGVLAKPFEPQLLIGRLKELLSGVRPSSGAPAAVSAGAPVASATPPASFDEDATVLMPRFPGATAPDGIKLDVSALDLHPEPPAPADASLDDYFDRLDAAFAHLTGSPAGRDPVGAPTPSSTGSWDGSSTPAPSGPAPAFSSAGESDAAGADFSLDRPAPASVFGPGPPAGATSAPSDDLDAAAAMLAVPVPDAFAALLDAEQDGTPDVVDAAEAPFAAGVMPPGTTVTEELVAAVARRVVELLGDGAVRDAVRDTVAATAERLVIEEIERIKASIR